MRQKPGTKRSHGEKIVKDFRRAARKQHSAEENRILLDLARNIFQLHGADHTGHAILREETS